MFPRCLLVLCACLTLTVCRSAHGDADKNAAVRTDQQGDPLPEGAVARLGTVRFRHGGCIEAGVFATDGKTLTTYGADEVIRTWAIPSGRQVAEVPRLGPRPEWIGAATFSANGKLLAIGCAERNNEDRLVLLYDARTGRELRRFTVKESGWGSESVALSSDGKLLAAGDVRGKITTWNTATGKRLYAIGWKRGKVSGLAFSADGSILGGGSGEDALALWDALSGRQLREIRQRGTGSLGKNSFRSRLVFLPNGKTLAAADSHHAMQLWDVQTGKDRLFLSEALLGDSIYGVAVSSDGTILAANTCHGEVSLWDAKTGRKRLRIGLQREWSGWSSQEILFAPDGRTLATWGCENAVRLWDAQTGKELNPCEAYRGRLHTLAFSPDSRFLAAGGNGRFVRLWEARTGKVLCGLPGTNGGLFAMIHAVAFSRDGKALACGGDSPGLRLFSVPEGELVRTLNLGDWASADVLAFPPDGRLLLSGCYQTGKVQFWDWRTGEEKRHLDVHQIDRLGLSRDGRFLVTGSERREVVGPVGRQLVLGDDPEIRRHGCVRFWNLATGKEIRHIEREGVQVEGVALLAAGRSALVVGNDRVLRWLEVVSGQERLNWKGCGSVAVSADSTLVAAGHDSGEVHLLDAATGKLRTRLSGHRGPVRAIAFSLDNRLMASAGADTTVLVWDLDRLRGERPSRKPLSDEQLEQCWQDLEKDAAVAAGAMAALAESPEQAVALLRKRLSPLEGGPERLARLIAGLDAEEFATREAASQRLALFGEVAVPALRAAQARNPSAEQSRRIEPLLDLAAASDFLAPSVRVCRALEVLEACGSAEARRLLQALATGEPKAWQTHEARASLARLAQLGQNR